VHRGLIDAVQASHARVEALLLRGGDLNLLEVEALRRAQFGKAQHCSSDDPSRMVLPGLSNLRAFFAVRRLSELDGFPCECVAIGACRRHNRNDWFNFIDSHLIFRDDFEFASLQSGLKPSC